MGVAKAVLNAVFQLLEIPRESRVEECENGVCVCISWKERAQGKGIYDMDSL